MESVPLILKYLFSSKLRVKILSHFFFHPGEEYHIRRIAGELNAPVGTVRRELAHLEEAGILSSRRVGNQKHYGLRKDSSVHDELRGIFLKTSGASLELRECLQKLAGVELAFIYGSYASGEANANSDIDLMVIGQASESQLAPVIARVERRLNREINYTIYTRGEAEKRIGAKGDFIHEVFSGPKIILTGTPDDRLLETS